MEIKKTYKKPTIKRIPLDNSISLNMLSGYNPPGPRPDPGKGKDPFESPFEDKPFG